MQKFSWILTAFIATAFGLASQGLAVTINYVGTEPGNEASAYATQNWSNSAVAKLYATGTSNTYGKNGYWQIRPMPWNPEESVISEGVSGGNNLGASAASNPTLTTGTLPSFISSLTGAAGTLVNYPGYAIFVGPDGSALYRQGGLSVSVAEGPYDLPGVPTYAGQTLSFTLTYSGTVRVGFAVDTVGSGAYAPNYVGIYSPELVNTTLSSALTRDSIPDLAVFDIVNPTGQTFSVFQWQTAGTEYVSAMSLVTFDLIPAAVPEPSTVVLFAAGGLAIAVKAMRRRRA